MKIDELISKLEKVKEEHGNLEITMNKSDYDFRTDGEIERIKTTEKIEKQKIKDSFGNEMFIDGDSYKEAVIITD